MNTDQAVKEQMRQYVQGALKPWYWRLWMRAVGERQVRQIGNFEFVIYTNQAATYVATCTTSIH